MLSCCADEALCEWDLLDDIKNKPYEVFVNDFMFCLCQECKVLWVPPCYTAYAIHPRSPLKAHICNYIRTNFRRAYAMRELIWYYSCKEEMMTEEETFEKYTLELKTRLKLLNGFLNKKIAYKIFKEILRISIDCIVFYERGMQDAICFGVTSMTELFREHFMKKPNRTFNEILDGISDLFRKFSIESFLPNVVDQYPDMFSCDILFFLCMKYHKAWFPNDDKKYDFHSKSPFTENIQCFLRKSLREIEVTSRNRSYQELLNILEEISSTSIPHEKSAEEVFLIVVRTAVVAVKMYKRGTLGILLSIKQNLSEALNKCNKRNNGRIFSLFDALVILHKSGNIRLRISPS